MINFFDNDMREIWASRDSGSTFPISRVYFESIQVWPSGTPPTPTGYTFSVSPTALTTDDSAKTVYFIITTNSPQWSVTPSQSWITVNSITGGTLEVSIAANSGVTDRQGALVFSYEKSSTGGTGYVAVDVVQEGVIPVHNNIIHYTSTNSQIVTPYRTSYTYYGARIVSNTYYPDEGYGEIVFDGDVTKIGDNAFNKCNSLYSITIPDNVALIDYNAFSGCTSLSSITIPDSVTSIGNGAFRGCTRLSSITIPDSVTSIGNEVFNRCTRLSSITIGSGVTSITLGAFDNCTRLSSITMPDSITSIGSYAFSGCTSLTSITIPSGVTSIGIYAFSDCTSLSSIVIPSGTTSIGQSTFANCTSLSSVTIPWGFTSIGQAAFSTCTSLSSITIPDTVTNIGNLAFQYCSSLSSVTIGSGVTSIGRRSFYYCTSLSNITYNGTKAQWAAITKDTDWHYRVPATVVHCTNGDTPI